MKEPTPHPFLSAVPDDGAGAQVLVCGIPADGGVSFRPGAAGGPEGIRRFSESIETYSPRSGRDLEDLRISDAGDHDGPLDAVGEAAGGLLDGAWGSGRPLVTFFGGDHSVTPHLVRAVAARSQRPALIGFDAHLDLREDHPGDHACTYRRITEAGVDCVVLGPRSGARSEWRDAPEVLRHHSSDLLLPPDVRKELEGRDVYVTVDIDVLDPSIAPGTGNPEPGGPSFGELLGAVEALEGLRVVAFDIVEVSPPLDPSGTTQAAAALLAREMILRFATA